MFFSTFLEVNGMSALVVLAVDSCFAVSIAPSYRIVMNHRTHYRFGFSFSPQLNPYPGHFPYSAGHVQIVKTIVKKGIVFFSLPSLPPLLLENFLGVTRAIICSRCCYVLVMGTLGWLIPKCSFFSSKETFMSVTKISPIYPL